MSFATTTALFFSTVDSPHRRVLRKLARFAELPQGWSYGQGIPVTSAAIRAARGLVLTASQLALEADVFPNFDGGCAVVFYRHEDRVEVTVGSDGSSFNVQAERGIGPVYSDLIQPIENATREQIYEQISRLLEHQTWSLSEYSTSDCLIAVVVDSRTLSTSIPLDQPIPRPLLMETGGSQSLIPLVPATP